MRIGHRPTHFSIGRFGGGHGRVSFRKLGGNGSLACLRRFSASQKEGRAQAHRDQEYGLDGLTEY